MKNLAPENKHYESYEKSIKFLTQQLTFQDSREVFLDILFIIYLLKKAASTNILNYIKNSKSLDVKRFTESVSLILKDKTNTHLNENLTQKEIELFQEVLQRLELWNKANFDIKFVVCNLIKEKYDFYKDVILMDSLTGGVNVDLRYIFCMLLLSDAGGNKFLDVNSKGANFTSWYIYTTESFNENNQTLHGEIYENDADLALSAKIKLSLLNSDITTISSLEDWEPDQSEIFLTRSLPKNHYDKIYCEIPLSSQYKYRGYYGWSDEMMLSQHFTEEFAEIFMKLKSMQWEYILKSVWGLSKDGKMLAVVPTGLLSKLIDSPMRKFLVENKYIKTIINLPKNSFEHTGISLSLIEISHGNDQITFIDFSRNKKIVNYNELSSIIDQRKDIKNIKKTIEINDIVNSPYMILNPSNIVYANEKNIINPTKLRDVSTDIYRGYQIPATKSKPLKDANDNIYLLSLKDISDSIISDNLTPIKKESNYERYLLQDSDVIISAKGNTIKAAVFKAKNKDIVLPSGNLLVIRPDTSKVNPYYLCAYLQSISGLKRLSLIQTGTVLLSLNVSMIDNFEIPLPSLSEQNLLGDKFKENILLLEMYKKNIDDIKLKLDYATESLTD